MRWIDEIIVGVLETYETSNPYDILNEIDVTVNKVDKYHPMLLGYNCTYIAELNSIFIRDDLNTKYEIFYLRHELGHIILHLDSRNILVRNDAKMEKEANYFAFRLSNVTFDEIALYEMSLEQIACSLEFPYSVLKQLVNV